MEYLREDFLERIDAVVRRERIVSAWALVIGLFFIIDPNNWEPSAVVGNHISPISSSC